MEHPTPGISTLLNGTGRDEIRSVLDLGPAASSSFRVYSRFARWMRFADLLGEARSNRGWDAALQALPALPERPYDLVFGWDILDRLFPEERPLLVDRLVEISATDARLHVVVDASEESRRPPLRFSLLDVDRLRYEPTGPPRPTRSRLLPAEVERILAPFRVVRAFTLKSGFREYVAIRGDGRTG